MAATASEYKRNFLASPEAAIAREQLELMAENIAYNTSSSYSSTQEGGISFVEKHMAYLSAHPKLSPKDYLANLRLMTKLKQRSNR